MALKQNYKDDVFTGNRKYTMAQSAGVVEFTDVTSYTQTGDNFGAADINATNTEINHLEYICQATFTAGGWTRNATQNRWEQSASVFPKDNQTGTLAYSLPTTANPIVTLYSATSKNQRKAYAKVHYMIVSATNRVTAYCYDDTAPSTTFSVLIKGV